MKPFLAGLAVLCASGCGDDGGVTGPGDENEVIPGITLTASVVEFLANPEAIPQGQIWHMSVRVTLTNTTEGAITTSRAARYPPVAPPMSRAHRLASAGEAYPLAA
jgi:hypothetical protein